MIETFLLLILLALVAGFIGALLGLGGGIVLVPGLTLLFGCNVKVAIATSLMSVIATSSAAATVYVSERFTNIRLGMTLELATTTGALMGGVLAVFVSGRYLYFLFAAVLVYAAASMLRGRGTAAEEAVTQPASSGLSAEFVDPASRKTVSYGVSAMPAGMLGSTAAGILSGMLGIGGGIVKVPLMNLVMGVPMKAAIATSNFMIGVTAAAGAFFYWTRGLTEPAVTAPSVIGVLVGARIGTRVAGRARTRALSLAFVVLLVITAVQMVLRGFGIALR
jgi:hypothetical protein